MQLRPATPDDLKDINRLMLRSKAYWGYDAAFMKACVAELTLTKADISNYPTIVVLSKGELVGVARITLSDPAILEELFIDPDFMGQGAGRTLFNWCADTARAAGCTSLILDADPQAEPFYLAMGSIRIGLAASGSIKNRFLPQMSYKL